MHVFKSHSSCTYLLILLRYGLNLYHTDYLNCQIISKIDKLAKDTTSQMMSLAIKSELKSEERTEFVDLKASLTIFVKELP